MFKLSEKGAGQRYEKIRKPSTSSIHHLISTRGVNMVDLSTSIGGIYLPSCIYNASGPRTGSSAAMAKITSSKSGGVLAKSATCEKQMGKI